jgi:hypothetical protein
MANGIHMLKCESQRINSGILWYKLYQFTSSKTIYLKNSKGLVRVFRFRPSMQGEQFDADNARHIPLPKNLRWRSVIPVSDRHITSWCRLCVSSLHDADKLYPMWQAARIRQTFTRKLIRHELKHQCIIWKYRCLRFLCHLLFQKQHKHGPHTHVQYSTNGEQVSVAVSRHSHAAKLALHRWACPPAFHDN